MMEEATGQEQSVTGSDKLESDAHFSPDRPDASHSADNKGMHTDGDVLETVSQAVTKDSGESTHERPQLSVEQMSGDHQTSQSPVLETDLETKLLENLSSNNASSALPSSTLSDAGTREYDCQFMTEPNDPLQLSSAIVVSDPDDNGTKLSSTQSDNSGDKAPSEHFEQYCNFELNMKTNQSHDVAVSNRDIELNLESKVLESEFVDTRDQDPCQVVLQMKQNTGTLLEKPPNQSISEENHKYTADIDRCSTLSDGDTFPEFLLCQKCRKPMNQPRILPCLHMFCGICISSTDCPECGEIIANGISDNSNKLLGFQNVFIENMIALELEKKADNVLCSICEIKEGKKLDRDENDGVYASFKCIDCGDMLCCTCADRHTFSSFTISHQVVDIKQLHNGQYDAKIRNLQQVKCRAHPQEEDVEFYCTDCCQVACKNCCLTIHSTHRLMNHHDAMETCRAELVAMQVELVEKMEKIDTERHEQIMAELKTAENTEIDKLELVVENLKEKIEKERKHILKKLKKAFTTNQCMYVKKKEETDNFITAVHNALQVTEKLLEDGCTAEILSISNVIENRMKKLIDEDTKEEFLRYEYLPQVFTNDVCTNRQKLGLFQLKFPLCESESMMAVQDDFRSTECVNEKSEHFPHKIRWHPDVEMDSNNDSDCLGQNVNLSQFVKADDKEHEVIPSLETEDQNSKQSFKQEYKLDQTYFNPIEDKPSGVHFEMNESHNPKKASSDFHYTKSEPGAMGDPPQLSMARVGHSPTQLPITGVKSTRISLVYKVDIKYHFPDQCKKRPKLIAVSAFPMGVGVYDAANDYVLTITQSEKMALHSISKGVNMAMGSSCHFISSRHNLDVYDRSGRVVKSMQLGNQSAFGHPLATTKTQLIICNFKEPSVRIYNFKLCKTDSFHLDEEIVDLSMRPSTENSDPWQYIFISSRGVVFSMDTHGVKDRFPLEREHKDWAPVSVSVDHHGHIFVVDVKRNKLVMLDPYCRLLEEWMLPEVHQPTAVACGSDGRVYVIAKNSQFVYVFNVNCDDIGKK